MILNTTTVPANVHVAFSKKLVVLRTPIIWLEEENPEAKPPPFEFWINTIRISNIEANRINTEINTYILQTYFLVLIINFSKNLIWSAK